MKTYIYKVINGSDKRGYNRTVIVYRMIRNKPEYLGTNAEINTASTYGDKGEAVQLIGKLENLKHTSYEFISKNINLWSV